MLAISNMRKCWLICLLLPSLLNFHFLCVYMYVCVYMYISHFLTFSFSLFIPILRFSLFGLKVRREMKCMEGCTFNFSFDTNCRLLHQLRDLVENKTNYYLFFPFPNITSKYREQYCKSVETFLINGISVLKNLN